MREALGFACLHDIPEKNDFHLGFHVLEDGLLLTAARGRL